MAWSAVSFATPEYEEYVPKWESMIRELGGIPIVILMDSTGDWALNTGLKPTAIMEAWNKVKTPWFLYLDIDVSIDAAPVIPEGTWHVGITDNLVRSHKNRISAADLVFKKTNQAWDFIKTWHLRCRQRPGKDHDRLTATIGVKLSITKNITGAVKWVPNGLRKPPPQEAVNKAIILYKYPSRGRPERFFRSLDTIYTHTLDKENFHVACTLDEDDEAMNTEEVKARIATYPNTSIQWGLSCSKIHAVNRDMPDVAWDIIVNMSDDMSFTHPGFDVCIRNEMASAFPENDGLLHFPDQDTGARLATLYIAGRNFYERFGYIYHPGFKSLWCDNLVQDIAQKLGKYRLLPYDINLHLNPAYGHCPKDEMFRAQQNDWDHDKALYLKIKANNYELP